MSEWVKKELWKFYNVRLRVENFENWKFYNVTYAKERKIEELRAETKRLRSNLEVKP